MIDNDCSISEYCYMHTMYVYLLTTSDTECFEDKQDNPRVCREPDTN